jgi:hypothetical protein
MHRRAETIQTIPRGGPVVTPVGAVPSRSDGPPRECRAQREAIERYRILSGAASEVAVAAAALRCEGDPEAKSPGMLRTALDVWAYALNEARATGIPLIPPQSIQFSCAVLGRDTYAPARDLEAQQVSYLRSALIKAAATPRLDDPLGEAIRVMGWTH